MATIELVHSAKAAPEQLNVIFVHGLGGHPRATWMSTIDIGSFWPMWVGEDADCSVWTLAYDADLSGWFNGAMPLPDQGSAMLDLLESEPRLKHAPIVLIGHSMGGLVIKTAVVHAMTMGVDRYKNLLERQLRAVVFIATPHFGSHLANLAKALNVILRTNVQLNDLTIHNYHLDTLHTQFCAQRQYLGLEVRSFCEGRGVLIGKRIFGIRLGTPLMVVNRTSSDPHLEGETPTRLGEDHFSICKPQDRTAQIHVSLVSFLTNLANPKKMINLSAHEDGDSSSRLLNESTPPFGFGELVETARTTKDRSLLPLESILFSVFTPDKEPYYYSRKVDEEVLNMLGYFGVWVSGPCGVGKTSLVLRNLFTSGITFLLLDLSAAVGKRGDSLMRSLFSTIKESLEFNGYKVTNNEKVSLDILDRIAFFLEENVSRHNLVLYIDEIPMDCAAEFEEFIERVIAIKTKVENLNPASRVRFVFSTISEPRTLVKARQQKIYETIKFVNLELWGQDDQKGLFRKIAAHLGLHFDNDTIDVILAAGNGTPRYIKNFLKNYTVMQAWSLERVITETKREVQL